MPGMRFQKAYSAVLSLLIVVWIYNWAITRWRNYLAHRIETASLYNKTLAEKWEYGLGSGLFKLASAAKETIPLYSRYKFLHELEPFTSSRVEYLLYPRVHDTEHPDFIIGYKRLLEGNDPGERIYEQAEDIYILRK